MKAIFTSFLLLIVMLSSAQTVVFKKRFPFFDYSELKQVVQLSDGSLVAAGTNWYDSTGAFAYKMFLVKLSADGDVLNSYLFNDIDDSTKFSYGYSIIKTSDGGLVVGGVARMKATLLKFDAGLNVTWQKTYMVGAVSDVQKVIQTPDGGFLMAGNTTDDLTGFSARGFYLMKTDNQGSQPSFAKIYSRATEVDIQGIAVTADNNYAVLSATTFGDTSYLTKVNSNGTVLWSRSLQATAAAAKYSLYATAVTATSDGGLLVGGSRSILFSPTDQQNYYIPFMTKYNTNGDTLWSKSIMLSQRTKCQSQCLAEDKDGGYLYTGYVNNFAADNSLIDGNAFSAKVTASGGLVWSKLVDPSNIGPDGYIRFENIIPTSDNGYVVCGERTFSTDNGVTYIKSSLVYKYNIEFLSCNAATVDDGNLTGFNIISKSITTVFRDTALTDTSGILVKARNTNAGVATCSDVLPLQLLSFNAVLQNRSVNVTWKTANETGTSYFVVERSADGVSFSALQKIAAKGNSSLTQSYSINDLQPLPGTSYYRLKETDKDGTIMYSSIVAVTITGNGVIIISPNPVQSMIHVVMQSTSNSTVSLQVLDIRGNLLAAQTRSVSAGRNEIDIPAASLAKGIYILKVMDNHSTQAVRFMKE